jgi:hypothetical protein
VSLQPYSHEPPVGSTLLIYLGTERDREIRRHDTYYPATIRQQDTFAPKQTSTALDLRLH